MVRAKKKTTFNFYTDNKHNNENKNKEKRTQKRVPTPRNIHIYSINKQYVEGAQSKVGDRSRGRPEGSLFNSYYTEV